MALTKKKLSLSQLNILTMHFKLAPTFLILFLCVTMYGQNATEIYLFDLVKTEDNYVIKNPVNISRIRVLIISQVFQRTVDPSYFHPLEMGKWILHNMKFLMTIEPG